MDISDDVTGGLFVCIWYKLVALGGVVVIKLFPRVVAANFLTCEGFNWEAEDDQAVLARAEQVERGFHHGSSGVEYAGVASVIVLKVWPDEPAETLRIVKADPECPLEPAHTDA